MFNILVEKRGAKPKPLPYIPRENIPSKRIMIVDGAFGETGSGKSTQTEKEIDLTLKYIPGLKNGRRVVILDTNGEYTKYANISLNNINDYGLECRRVNMKGWSQEEKKRALLYCARTFRDGRLIADDIDDYAAYDRSQDIISILMGNRHKLLDITIIHQSLEMATPNFWRNASSIRIHQQSYDDSILKERSKGKFPIIKIAALIVERQYLNFNNPYFFLNVHIRKWKIEGCPIRAEFIYACEMYLSLYPKEIKQEKARIGAEYRMASKRLPVASQLEKIAYERTVQRLLKYWVPMAG